MEETVLAGSIDNSVSSRPETLRGRLIKNCGATAMSPLITIVIQLGTVPLLLHAWGAEKFGEWLVLSAVPAYLTWSNLGIGDSSGNEMIMRVAAGDRKGALETFQTCWAFLTFCCGLALCCACVVVWQCPWCVWLHLSSVSCTEAARIVMAFSAYIIVGQQNSIVESGFRCDGNFVLGTMLGSLLRLSEAVVGTIVAVLGGTLLSVAIAYLVTRVLGTILYAMALHFKSPWLTFGLRHARWARIKALAAPAFGFLVLPLGQAVTQQGLVIVISATIGPVAVSMFSTLRTLSRVGLQAVMVVGFAFWPEMSRSFGSKDTFLSRILHRQVFRVAVALSLSACLFLSVFGPSIYRLWLHSAVRLDVSALHILLFVTLANSLWYTSSVVSTSANTHSRLAMTYFLLSITVLGLAAWAAPLFGLRGPAFALLFLDSVMCWIVIRAALRQTEDTPFAFLSALCSWPPAFPRRRPFRGFGEPFAEVKRTMWSLARRVAFAERASRRDS